LQAELTAFSDPVAHGGRAAFGVREAAKVGDTEIRIRGEAEKLGPIAPRGFLSVVQVADAPRIVWGHLFGKALVKSVDNFGVNGDTPSHPELLDHLAARFIRDGWSIKQLVRALVLTRGS
jgi:hypothetical protein